MAPAALAAKRPAPSPEWPPGGSSPRWPAPPRCRWPACSPATAGCSRSPSSAGCWPCTRPRAVRAHRAARAVAGAGLPGWGRRGVRRRPAGHQHPAAGLGRARARLRRRGQGVGHRAGGRDARARLPGTRRLLAFAAGVAAGFLLPVCRSRWLARGPFCHSVIVAQLVRTDLCGSRSATGCSTWPAWPWATAAAAVLAVDRGRSHRAHRWCSARSLAACASPAGGRRRWTSSPRPPSLAVIGLPVPDDFYYHYAGFLAPFLGWPSRLPPPGCSARRPVTRCRAARPGRGFARRGLPSRRAGARRPSPSSSELCPEPTRRAHRLCTRDQRARGGYPVRRLRGHRPGLVQIAINRLTSSRPGCSTDGRRHRHRLRALPAATTG